MADTKLSDLTAVTSAADTDLLYLGKDPAGTPLSRKIAKSDFLKVGTDIQAYSAVLAATTASYTTAEETKLAGIEASADVTDTANVTAAGALMDVRVIR